MSEKIEFQSKWFERCIRDYLKLSFDEPIIQEALDIIKYLYVTTNDYEIGFGKGDLPKHDFGFDDTGEEWDYCVQNPGRFENFDKLIKVGDVNYGTYQFLTLTVRKEIEAICEKENDSRDYDEEGMALFEESVKKYMPEDDEFDGLEEDEETNDCGILVAEDFTYLRNLEVLRLMDCQQEIHDLSFLRNLTKLRVLELGEVQLSTLEGTERILDMEELCIWPAFSYYD